MSVYEPQSMSITDVAELMLCSKKTVRRWMKGGGSDTPLPAKRVGRQWRMRLGDVLVWAYDSRKWWIFETLRNDPRARKKTGRKSFYERDGDE